MKRYIKSSISTSRIDWRNLKVGDNLIYLGEEFGIRFSYPCTVVEVDEDCAIAKEPTVPMTLLIDDFDSDMFRKDA